MSFEATYDKILKAKGRHKRGPVRKLNLGDTESGRAQMKPVVPKREESDNPELSSMIQMREIPAYRGHASKGIRKRGTMWR